MILLAIPLFLLGLIWALIWAALKAGVHAALGLLVLFLLSALAFWLVKGGLGA